MVLYLVLIILLLGLKNKTKTSEYLPTRGVLTPPSQAGHFDVDLLLNFTYHQENEKSLGPNRKAADSLIHSGVLIHQRVPASSHQNNSAQWLGGPTSNEMP